MPKLKQRWWVELHIRQHEIDDNDNTIITYDDTDPAFLKYFPSEKDAEEFASEVLSLLEKHGMF